MANKRSINGDHPVFQYRIKRGKNACLIIKENIKGPSDSFEAVERNDELTSERKKTVGKEKKLRKRARVKDAVIGVKRVKSVENRKASGW